MGGWGDEAQPSESLPFHAFKHRQHIDKTVVTAFKSVSLNHHLMPFFFFIYPSTQVEFTTNITDIVLFVLINLFKGVLNLATFFI